jgi:hypothetical protein
MRRHKLSTAKEEKVAARIGKELSDFTLDLDSVGYYLARSQPYLIYRRALEVLESAEYNKEAIEYNLMGENNERLF